jgi:hypothetical protein
LRNPKSDKVSLRKVERVVDIPESAEIYCVHVDDQWGLDDPQWETVQCGIAMLAARAGKRVQVQFSNRWRNARLNDGKWEHEADGKAIGEWVRFGASEANSWRIENEKASETATQCAMRLETEQIERRAKKVRLLFKCLCERNPEPDDAWETAECLVAELEAIERECGKESE